MFNGVVIAPARMLGAPRNTNPINEQGNLPLSDRPVTTEERFPDTIGKKSIINGKHTFDYGTVVDFGNRLLERDTMNQKVAHEMAKYNAVSLPGAIAEPIIDGPVV